MTAKKFLLIAPGEMPIPPVSGWGALERVVWSYKTELEKLGHTVAIFNDADSFKCLDLYREFRPDVIHLHLGKHFELMKLLRAPIKLVTSHAGNFEACKGFFGNVAGNFLSDCTFSVLTSWESEFFSSIGVRSVNIIPNGVDIDRFAGAGTGTPVLPASIYLAKVAPIKRQALLQRAGINCFFAGPIQDPSFDSSDPNYLGNWTEEEVNENLPRFSNLVLLSEMELQPLVCLEALAAGLGLVISECAAQNLDTSKPWIKVIDEEELKDISYVNNCITENAKLALSCRDEIREYASRFSWKNIIKNEYIPMLQKLSN